MAARFHCRLRSPWRRGHRGWRLVPALGLVLLLSAAAALAQDPPSAQEIEAALARFAEQIGELEQQLEREPEHPTAWQVLVQVRSMERAVRMRHEGRSSTVEESLDWARDRYREWIAAQPWNGRAYIALAATYPVPERAELVVDFTSQVTDSPELLEWALWTLKHAGQSDRGTQIAERYVADNPDDGAVYAKVYMHYINLGQQTAADDLLDRWLGAVPGDGLALSHWITRRWPQLEDEAGRRDAAEEALGRFAPTPEGLQLCQTIGRFGDLALDCYARLLGAGLSTEQQDRVLAGMAKLSGSGSGDLDGLLARLSPERRERTLLDLSMNAARQESCDEGLAWADRAPLGSSTAGLAVAVLLRHCSDDAGDRARVMALVPQLSDEAMPALLTNLPLETPFAAIEAEARRRLAAGSDNPQLWSHLDGLYKRAGMSEKRLDHLRAWSEAVEPGRFHHYDDWAELLLELGRVDEALALLARVTRPGGPGDRVDLLEQLAGLYLAQSRFDDAEDVVRRVRQLEGPDTRWSRGDLLLARLAWAQGDVGEAEAAYRRHLERNAAAPSGSLHEDALREYAFLAIAAGHEGELLALLEESYRQIRRQPNQTISGSLEAWVAKQLEELRLFEPALGYLERAAENEPGNLELLERLAAAALESEQPERAERALRSLLQADPENPEHWSRLAGLYLAGERPRQARQLLARAPEAARREAPAIDLALARTYSAEGDLIAAIRTLRAVRQRWGLSSLVREELRDAYRALAEAEGEAGSGAAEGSQR